MSRNKKNWDALVDDKGNYDFSGPKGDLGPKGQKGVKGLKGQKGQTQRVLTFRGEVATQADLDTPATDPKAAGDVWLVEDVNQLWGYNGTSFVQLADAITAIKGQKGQNGQKGTKGEKGIEGIKGLSGAKGEKGIKGDKGIKGVFGVAGAKGD